MFLKIFKLILGIKGISCLLNKFRNFFWLIFWVKNEFYSWNFFIFEKNIFCKWMLINFLNFLYLYFFFFFFMNFKEISCNFLFMNFKEFFLLIFFWVFFYKLWFISFIILVVLSFWSCFKNLFLVNKVNILFK